MMRKNTLIKLSHSGKIDHVTVEEIGTDRVIHCASLFVSKRGMIYFNDENRKALLSFGIGNVVIIREWTMSLSRIMNTYSSLNLRTAQLIR